MSIPNLGNRLGKMLHEAIADRFKRPGENVDEAPAESAPPATELPTASEAAPAPESASTETAAPATNVATSTDDTSAPTVDTSSASTSAPEPVASAAPAEAPLPTAATPAAQEKSAEELEEERLWGEVDRAWAAEQFEKVTVLLDRLRTLQPEDAAEIDQKIAAAQYNAGAHFEQSGELSRALYLYHEAQRRNPNLGEVGFAIERVQSALDAAARPATAQAPATAPAARTYTVQSGDSLWAIAERFYGNGAEWSKIHEANREQVPNPDLIQPGQVLTIP